MSTRSDLHGPRWSSAVRCAARAEYQALDYPADPEALTYLQGAFERGVNAAENWIADQGRKLDAEGKRWSAEVPVKWGPPELEWEGHADLVVWDDRLVVEAYHAVGGEFRPVKALQAAGYAVGLSDEQGPFDSMLAALDTTALTEDAGFEVTYHPLDTRGLQAEVEDIAARVANAHARGTVDPADKVGDSPLHAECKACQFRAPCWEGWIPPDVQELGDLDDVFERLVILQSDRVHAKAKLDSITQMLEEARAQVRPYLRPGQSASANGVLVRRVEFAPRRTFRLSDYLKAGHPFTPTMADYAHESEKPGEKWTVSRVNP